MQTKSTALFIEDIELTIFYTYSPSRPATRDPGGNFIDPPEPSSVDISGIYLASKESDLYDLFSYSLIDIEEKLLEQIENSED